jgi:hypothetical protein
MSCKRLREAWMFIRIDILVMTVKNKCKGLGTAFGSGAEKIIEAKKIQGSSEKWR